MTRITRPAVFMHIQKTAGTSVKVMAKRVYGKGNIVSYGDYVTLGLSGCRQVPFVSGHFGFAFAEALMDGRYSFTFLRDPVERLISLYRFCLTRNPEQLPLYRVAQSGDFLHFLEPIHGDAHWSTVWNNQAFQLYSGWGAHLAGLGYDLAWQVPPDRLASVAIEHLARFDHVGFQHTFSQDIRTIFSALGGRGVRERRANVTKGNVGFADLPQETQQRLHEVTAIDRAVYDAAVERYEGHGQRPGLWARLAPFSFR